MTLPEMRREIETILSECPSSLALWRFAFCYDIWPQSYPAARPSWWRVDDDLTQDYGGRVLLGIVTRIGFGDEPHLA